MINPVKVATRADGVPLYRYESSEKVKIVQSGTGNLYDHIIDDGSHTYTESDIPIPTEPEEVTDADKAEAYDILTGVSE